MADGQPGWLYKGTRHQVQIRMCDSRFWGPLGKNASQAELQPATGVGHRLPRSVHRAPHAEAKRTLIIPRICLHVLDKPTTSVAEGWRIW